ncbi:MAG TPA: hypothetical protein VMU77_01125 [Acidimicrobiales bacterium]|nr:hypothetical protein [Acidimicrobiales bacterium]
MRWFRRLLPTALVLILVAVGGHVLISHAQTSEVSGLASSSGTSNTSTTLATQASFVANANTVCGEFVIQLNSWVSNFNQEIQNAGKAYPNNQGNAATSPLFGTPTTSATSSVNPNSLANGTVSGSSGSTVSPSAVVTTPSGSFDTSQVQSDPLAIVNVLLNQYMDELDAIVGMQNDVLAQLENLSEPPSDVPVLQAMWVTATEAMVAQNQADTVLENLISDYYNAGFLAQINTLNGLSMSNSQAETQEIDQAMLSQDLAELGSTSPTVGSAISGTLEANVDAAASAADNELGGYGLSQCEIAGVDFQDFQMLPVSIPNVSNDYIDLYTQQASAGQPISLAQVLNKLSQPVAINASFPTPTASTPSTTLPTGS